MDLLTLDECVKTQQPNPVFNVVWLQVCLCVFVLILVHWPGVCILSECLCCLCCRTVTSGSSTSTSCAPTWAFTSDTSSSCASGVARTLTWSSILMSTWKHTQVRKDEGCKVSLAFCHVCFWSKNVFTILVYTFKVCYEYRSFSSNW